MAVDHDLKQMITQVMNGEAELERLRNVFVAAKASMETHGAKLRELRSKLLTHISRGSPERVIRFDGKTYLVKKGTPPNLQCVFPVTVEE
jgi:hypothetical protein